MDTSETSALTASDTVIVDIQNPNNPTIGSAGSSSSSVRVSDTPTGSDPSASSQHITPGNEESSSIGDMDTSETSALTASDTVIVDIQNQSNPTIGSASSSSSSATVTDIPPGSDPSASSQHITPGNEESQSFGDTSSSNVAASENQNDPTNNIQDAISRRLLDGRRDHRHHKLWLDLLESVVEGNGSKAKSLIYEDPWLLKEAITQKQDTVLHVAAGAKKTVFVKDMIHFMEKNHSLTTLRLRNNIGNTAFCLAAMAGSMPIAEAMLNADRSLLNIRGGENNTPLFLAALFGQKEMARYLFDEMVKHGIEQLNLNDRKTTFFISIRNTWYDLAGKLLDLDNNDGLATAEYRFGDNDERTPLHLLAQTPLHLLDQTIKGDKTASSDQALKLIEAIWSKILDREGAQVWDYFSEHQNLLFDAAHLGNFKFLKELIRLYPDLVHQIDRNQRTIFHIAIMHRHDGVFNLIHRIGFNKQLIALYEDDEGNSLLHLAAKYPDQSPVNKQPGAALEMQRELRIFKDVELLVMPSMRHSKNRNGQTPQELFTRTHANLLEKGQKWMRDTASQCMLVGTIIATVVFSAAFSVPGGDDDKEGIPIHRRNILFQIFFMADGIALSTSSISILMFLSILTSRYAENDFYRSLPLKLVGGLLGLSISIASMMLAFISIFFIAYGHHRSNAIPVVGTLFTILPVFVFVSSQYSLLRDIVFSDVLNPSQLRQLLRASNHERPSNF